MTSIASPIATHPPSNEPSPQRGRKRRRSSAASPPPATTSTSTNFRGRVRHRSPHTSHLLTSSPRPLSSPLNPKTSNPTTTSLAATAPNTKYQKTRSTATTTSSSPSSFISIHSPRSKTRRSQSPSRSRSKGHSSDRDVPRRRQRTRSRSRAHRVSIDEKDDRKGKLKTLSGIEGT
ncbi:fe788ebe-8d82-4348-b998-91b244eb3737-CDS [Sclerotinia trifoliorum]|uniref:Fe788ebe-8d82-4348-b998-91b244eb3737-CDS n=1 Tax=Sclerotinia trifoliorum TaxID=28548 RepID=A0A8H2VY39_9HELO|nr:fe788ebe-8d82-4348-b998-91b244eb3737-CDS [Sclerotinia trifoliorum]